MATVTVAGTNDKIDVKVMAVTPAMAEAWLEVKGPNRSISNARVDRYAQDMKSGNWRVNGETVKFDHAGNLLDGQHRLWAIVESRATVTLTIVRGLDPDDMSTIDTGLARSFANVLQIKGEGNTSVLAGAARFWYGYDNRVLTAGGIPTVSHAELLKVIEAKPWLRERVSEYAASPAKKIGQPTVMAFLYSGAARNGKDTKRAEAALRWLETVGTGLCQNAKDPAYLFRERILQNARAKSKLPPQVLAALGIKSWNAFASGRTLHTLHWRAGGTTAEPYPVFG
jgi:hypothetical protein